MGQAVYEGCVVFLHDVLERYRWYATNASHVYQFEHGEEEDLLAMREEVTYYRQRWTRGGNTRRGSMIETLASHGSKGHLAIGKPRCLWGWLAVGLGMLKSAQEFPPPGHSQTQKYRGKKRSGVTPMIDPNDPDIARFVSG